MNLNLLAVRDPMFALFETLAIFLSWRHSLRIHHEFQHPSELRRYNLPVRIRSFTVATVALAGCCLASAQELPATARADQVIVMKKERTLTLMSQGKVLKTYRVALGGDPLGPKDRQGDHRTPEGAYVLDRRNVQSKFYKSIHISYPDAKDVARAGKMQVSPGGDVYVHGLPNGYKWVGSNHRLKDWTDGCIAVTDEEIDEIWRAVRDGTPIEIKP
jgi:murein L,D-transpeptidase YafK